MAQQQQQQFPQLTFEQAKGILLLLLLIPFFFLNLFNIEALNEAIEAFEIPENKERMEVALASCQGLEPPQKMMILLPLVQEIQGETMVKYGFSGPGAVLNATLQIQMHAMKDPDMQSKVRALMAKAMGN